MVNQASDAAAQATALPQLCVQALDHLRIDLGKRDVPKSRPDCAPHVTGVLVSGLDLYVKSSQPAFECLSQCDLGPRRSSSILVGQESSSKLLRLRPARRRTRQLDAFEG